MNEVMKTLLSLSVSGTLLLLLILGFKMLCKNKFSRRWQYYIWFIVALRFLFPVSFGTTVVGTVFERLYIVHITDEAVSGQDKSFFVSMVGNETGQRISSAVSNEKEIPPVVNEENETGQTKSSANENEAHKMQPWTDENEAERAQLQFALKRIMDYLFFLWSVIVLVLFIRKIIIYQGFIRYIRIGNAKVSDIKTLNLLSDCRKILNIRIKVEIYRNPQIISPMMVGFFRPYIILPDGEFEDKELSYIFMHELIHCKQRDVFYKWLIQLVVCLHWFNPFVYFLEKEVNKACELSCDEKVISVLDDKARREYGDTLISFMKKGSSYKNSLVYVTMSEGAEQIKERLGAIMNFKKKSKIIIAVTTVLSVVFIACFFVAGAYAKPSVSNSNSISKKSSETLNLVVETAASIGEVSDKVPSSSVHSPSGTIANVSKNDYLPVAKKKAKAEKTYAAKRSDGILTLFEDYDTVISLCSDACGEYIQSVRNKQGTDFSPYILNPTLIKYMQYRVNNHIYTYETGAKYKFFVRNVDFRDEYAVVEGSLATYSELDSDKMSVCMEGPICFTVKVSDGKCVISDWYWGGLDSPDEKYRGEFSISDDLDFWENPSKYGRLLNVLNIE